MLGANNKPIGVDDRVRGRGRLDEGHAEVYAKSPEFGLEDRDDMLIVPAEHI